MSSVVRLRRSPPLYFVQTPATHAAARLADGAATAGCSATAAWMPDTRRERGCVRSKGGGAGRRPAPGTFARSPRSLQRSTTHASTAIATAQRLDLRIVESHSLGRRDALHAEGAGCVRSKGGGAGRRPAPGTFARSPAPSDARPTRFCSSPATHKNAAPMFRRPRQERRCRGRGRDQNTKLMPATGPLNSCFRPTVPSLPFLSTSSLNQS